MLQRYVHFVQCIHKTHSHHEKKMQDNIRIVLTLSILKNKKYCNYRLDRNKINKVHNAYSCFIKFKVGNWSEKKKKKKNLLALFCIVCQNVISTGTISNTSIYQPQSVTAKLLIIQGHIKMRDDVL